MKTLLKNGRVVTELDDTAKRLDMEAEITFKVGKIFMLCPMCQATLLMIERQDLADLCE